MRTGHWPLDRGDPGRIAIADRAKSARVLSLAYGSLGFVLQKFEKLDEARGAYTDALLHAESAGDAGSVATTRLNLATIASAWGIVTGILISLSGTVAWPPSRKTTWSCWQMRRSG